MSEPCARCAKLEALCEEVWGVLVTAALMEKTTHPDVRAALTRVDRRLRAAGLKRFPPAPEPAAVARDIAESPK